MPESKMHPFQEKDKKFSEAEMILWPDDDGEYVKEYFEGKHRPYQVVKELIDNDTVDKINPAYLKAFRYSEGGAQGSDAGTIGLICLYGEKVHILTGDFAYGDTDMHKVNKVLPKFMSRKNAKADGWKLIFSDSGHNYFVRSEIAADIESNVKDCIAPEFENLVVKALHGTFVTPEMMIAKMREKLRALKQEKSEKYKDLIEEVKADYKQREIDSAKDNNNNNLGLRWCDYCNEINLWTYWQGYGYADKTPNVKIMVVGQDFGNPDGPFSKGNNIRHILSASDGSDIQYLGGIYDKDIAETDSNLVDIFKEVLDIDIRNKRHPELFFTNFCLGYRTGNDTGGMTSSIMMKDAEYFKRLCNIIAPEKIICLGLLTYEYVVFALKGTIPQINGYNNLLDKCVPEVISFGKKECRIYASAHTGYYGMLNRSKNADKEARKKLVINDWKKIFDKVVPDTEKKLIGFESEWESWDRCDADAISMYKVSLLGSNRKIIIRQAARNNPEFAVYTIKVDKKESDNLFSKLNDFVAVWKNDYEKPVCDGYHWKIKLSYDDGTQRIVNGVVDSVPDNAKAVEKLFQDLTCRYNIEYFIF